MGMNAFGVVRLPRQYASSRGRTRRRSTGNGGFHSSSVGESVMPGYSGAIARSPADTGTTPASVKVADLVTRRPGSSQR